MPLLAIQFGASAMLLGATGAIAQALRFPLCLISGRLSERVGRTKVMVPAGIALILSALGLVVATSNYHVVPLFALALMSIGAFFPPFQAMICDVSQPGQLRKNLGAYNIGWCFGSAGAALCAPLVIRHSGLDALFGGGAAAAVIALVLVVAWGRHSTRHIQDTDSPATPVVYPSYMLFIARMGHFVAFFGQATIRILFPRLATELKWSKPEIAGVIAMLMVGQAIGVAVTSISPWWRGKLWPQLAAQAVIMVTGVTTACVTSPTLFGLCFLAIGVALTVAYTAALYLGMSGRTDVGRNTGIHEGLVAGAMVAGSLLGGLVAQFISLRAPYMLLAILAAAAIVTTLAISNCVRYRERHMAKTPVG